MKLILFTLLVVCFIAICMTADVDYDYEEIAIASAAPIAPITSKQIAPSQVTTAKSSKLGGLHSLRNRGTGLLATRKSPVTAIQTMITVKSTTSTEQSGEQYEQYDEAEEDGVKLYVSTTTTTELPKKFGRSGVIRPFRSNEDLLAALKRRRAQGVTPHTREITTIQIPAEIMPSKSKPQYNSSRIKASNSNEVPKSTSRVRFGGMRGKPIPINQEEAQETQSENVQIKLKAHRRG